MKAVVLLSKNCSFCRTLENIFGDLLKNLVTVYYEDDEKTFSKYLNSIRNLLPEDLRSEKKISPIIIEYENDKPKQVHLGLSMCINFLNNMKK